MMVAILSPVLALLRLRFLLSRCHRHGQLALESVAGIPVLVLPQVFNPRLFRSSEFFVRQLARRDLLPAGCRALDLGTGSGLLAVAAARAGCSVVAVDITPAAARCARINALLSGVDTHVDVRLGDLFDPVPGERFDVVLFSPPFYRGTPRDALDYAWRAPDVIERFAASLSDHLETGGHALLLLSTEGDGSAYLAALHASGFTTTIVAQRARIVDCLSIYRVARVTEPVARP